MTWRFTNTPSRLVTSGGVRCHNKWFGRLGADSLLTGIWPDSP